MRSLQNDPARAGRKKRHLLKNKSLDGYPQVPFCTQVNIAKK